MIIIIMDNLPEWVERLVKRLERSTMFKNIYFSDGSLPVREDASLLEVPRVMLVTRGRREICFPHKGQERYGWVDAATPLVIFPGSWVLVERPARFECFTLVVRESVTRVVYLPYAEYAGSMYQRRGRMLWYHAESPPSVALKRQLALVAEMFTRDFSVEDMSYALVAATRIAAKDIMAPISVRASKSQRTWEALRAFIDERYHLDLSRASLAREFGLSPNHIGKLFQRHSDRSLKDYLLDLRLARARKLLESRDLTVKEVAARCGLKNSHRLIRCFKERFDVTPGAY